MGKQARGKLWSKIQTELILWRVGALPGLLVIGLVIGLRLTGVLQPMEWWALDFFLRLRPQESTDRRLLIVAINERDIQTIGTYPIPDRDLARVIEQLQTHQPRAIGVDIARDLPVEPGHATLAQAFSQNSNLFGIETALPDVTGTTIQPPPMLSPGHVGFVDTVVDADGSLRRSLIATPTPDGEYKFSLALLLSEFYLASQGYLLEPATDPNTIRFGSTELTRVQPNSGGYANADANGNQILINYHSGTKPFQSVSMMDVLQGKVPENWIHDRVVLIGLTASSSGDRFSSSAVNSPIPGLIYGVEYHAHVVSQILGAVLDQRPLLKTWVDPWEYLWIIGWGLFGILLCRLLFSPVNILLALGVASTALVWVCWTLLVLWGWWLPVVPALTVLLFNGAGLSAVLFYRYQQDLKDKVQERQLVIEQTFDAIHNGPLQTLATMLRNIPDPDFSREQICSDLEHLNHELRTVYESVRQETIPQDVQLYFCGDVKLNLHHALHESLYEVYRATLTRDFPCFKTLKVKVVRFENMDQRPLSPEQKRGLCRFLEEALCNAGKYATGMNRLEVCCRSEKGQNVIRVVDNGNQTELLRQQHVGRGTQQAKKLARQLRGTFRRSANTPKGTICELSYPIAKLWFW